MADLALKDHPAAKHLDAISQAHDALSNLFRSQVEMQAQMNSKSNSSGGSQATQDLGLSK